jgi:hypothetical protein
MSSRWGHFRFLDAETNNPCRGRADASGYEKELLRAPSFVEDSMKRQSKKKQFWHPQGPSSGRYMRGRWRRLRATHTEGELRSQFEDYPGPLKEHQREPFAGFQPQNAPSIRPTIH